jgi:hypothetical protein
LLFSIAEAQRLVLRASLVKEFPAGSGAKLLLQPAFLNNQQGDANAYAVNFGYGLNAFHGGGLR